MKQTMQILQKRSEQKSQTSSLVVFSLGHFEVNYGDISLSDKRYRSMHLWELLKYFIASAGKPLLAETIIKDLWPNHKYEDPKRVLRTLVYRLRKILDLDPEMHRIILFSGGYYRWNTDAPYYLDIEEFESLSDDATALKLIETEKAIGYLKRAVSIYRGDFLQESSNSEWAVPLRYHFKRLFHDDVNTLCRLLRSVNKADEIIPICEAAIAVEPFEENFHRLLYDAMMSCGHTKQADDYAAFFFKRFDKHISSKPIFTQSIAVPSKPKGKKTLPQSKQDSAGAFWCSHNYFLSLCEIEIRRMRRSGRNSSLCMVSLENHEHIEMSIAKSICDLLRESDIASISDDGALLILMPDMDPANARSAIVRVLHNLANKNSFQEKNYLATAKLLTNTKDIFKREV